VTVTLFHLLCSARAACDDAAVKAAVILMLVLGSTASAALAPPDDNPVAAARAHYRNEHRAELEAKANACQRQGGRFDYRGLGLAPLCVIRTSDGGRECRSRSDCEGPCVGEAPRIDLTRVRPGQPLVGQCTTERAHFGCFVAVENGRAGEAICVD
jgi:hypothetical protein